MAAKNANNSHASQDVKIAVDNCIFTLKDGKLNILLIKMKQKFPGQWALPGGLIKNNETLDNAAQRILREETAVSDIYLEQLYTFGQISRDPFGRVVSCAYFALIPTADIKLKTGVKYTDVQWREFDKLPKLAYDHNQIAAYAKKRLESKITYTNIVWSLLPEKFTLSQLQKVYEIILNKKLDKRNFRKKLLALDLISAVAEKAALGAHRPAQLYKFKARKAEIIEIL